MTREDKVLNYILTIRKHNTNEWMHGLAEIISRPDEDIIFYYDKRDKTIHQEWRDR